MRSVRSIHSCGGQPIGPYLTQAGATALKVLTFHTPLPELPNRQSSPCHLRAPPDLHIIQNLPQIPRFKFKGPMVAPWFSDHSANYRSLRLCLAMANDLSLAIGLLRIDRKVTLMQLGHQFNSYNLMHIQES
jgi:hypothetical protein